MADHLSHLHAWSPRLVAARDRVVEHVDTIAAMDDLAETLLATRHLAQLEEDLMLEVLFHDLMLEASLVPHSVQVN